MHILNKILGATGMAMMFFGIGAMDSPTIKATVLAVIIAIVGTSFVFVSARRMENEEPRKN